MRYTMLPPSWRCHQLDIEENFDGNAAIHNAMIDTQDSEPIGSECAEPGDNLGYLEIEDARGQMRLCWRWGEQEISDAGAGGPMAVKQNTATKLKLSIVIAACSAKY